MKDKHIPLELIQQLKRWISLNVSRPVPSSSAYELRQVDEIMKRYSALRMKVPVELQRKRDELQEIVSTPNEDESFLNKLSEELSSLAKDIRRRIGNSGAGTRAPAKRLRVRLPDGRYICEEKAVDTFIEVLTFMGLAKCAQITSVIQLGYPVVATRPNRNEDLQPGNIKEVGGYYIETKTSTDRKAEQLREYAEALRIGIHVEVID